MECERKKDVICEITCLDIKSSSTDSLKMLVFKFSNNMNKDKNGKILEGNGMGMEGDLLMGLGPGSPIGTHLKSQHNQHDDFAHFRQNTESSRGIPEEDREPITRAPE
jgi:hypothetical protein